jgi:membrane protein implicated in regulation of membrane protease activity
LGLVRFLMASANIPFAMALGIAVLFVLLQVSGLLGLLAGGEGDHGHDVHHEAGPSWATGAFGPLGAGKLPLSLIGQTFLAVFAASGLALNAGYVDAPGGVPLVSLAWSLPSSLLLAYKATALLARLLGPVFAPRQQEATSRDELVGAIGVVISSAVDEQFGEIRVRDKSGHDLRVVCRLAPSARDAPSRAKSVIHSASVVVVECERGELLVEPFEDEEDMGETKGRPS